MKTGSIINKRVKIPNNLAEANKNTIFSLGKANNLSYKNKADKSIVPRPIGKIVKILIIETIALIPITIGNILIVPTLINQKY